MENSPDKIYEKFANLAGAEHIATIINIRKIAEICKEEKPLRVLELGGGIGTLSYTILANSNAVLDIYEDDEFCLKSLETNLAQFKGRFNIILSYRILPPVRFYDLMIIDGGQNESYHPEWFFIRYVKRIKTIYIEGVRRSQYAWVSKALRNSYVCKLTRISSAVVNGVSYKGGKLIRCQLSDSLILRNLSYVYNRLTEDYLFDRLYKFILRFIKI